MDPGEGHNESRHMVGSSPAFVREVQKARQAARVDVPIFISGETGTGKEVCARDIHHFSPRAAKPFVPLNGGAIPVDLLENELFGHAPEAYTGASSSCDGLLADAEGGTLFLDEIDCFPLSAQVKLLRFLQEKEYRPLGTQRIRRANVRVLAATNAVPQHLLNQGRLRSDLYYRLNTVPITLPPLRTRQEDIVPLARHFLRKYVTEFGGSARDFSPDALMRLQLYGWPGNVRELEHVVQRAVVFAGSDTTIRSEIIQLDASGDAPPIRSFLEEKAQVVAEFERSYITKLLRAHRGNITRAAEAAQKNRRAFWELMRKHDIDADLYRQL